jgi:curli biogenesis system outer membrane secretion channel CsgG
MSDMKSSMIIAAGVASVGLMALMSDASTAQGVTGYQPGQGGSPVQGAAGTSSTVGDNGLRHCSKPMGAMAVVEPQDVTLQSLLHYSLPSPTSLIRMMIQQSNCFIVVERGAGMQNMKQERMLASGGDLRAGSNMGGGQMVGADFVLTPNVIFSESNAGGLGGGLSGLLPGTGGSVLGAVAGGVKFKEAQTSMLVSDTRSGVQVASAEGSTRKADLQLGGSLFGASGGANAGGYGNTDEGKIIAGAFLDNYNKIVLVVMDDPSLQRSIGTLRQEAAATGPAGATATPVTAVTAAPAIAAGPVASPGTAFNEGDVVVPKIANVKMLSAANDSAKPTATLGRGEQLVVIGTEQNGYLQVQGGSASGWVKKVLLTHQN